MDPVPGLFTALTLIAAPAVLTNASSVLALNTANRFGRVVDRSRIVSEELARLDPAAPLHALRTRQLERLHGRAQILMRVQSAIYAALGCFVGTALVAIMGALLSSAVSGAAVASAILGFASLAIGTAGAGSLVFGCVLLVRETRWALAGMREDVSPFGHALPGPTPPAPALPEPR